MPDDRRYYDLEAFWSHGESRVYLPPAQTFEEPMDEFHAPFLLSRDHEEFQQLTQSGSLPGR